jgi:hypothetical protein
MTLFSYDAVSAVSCERLDLGHAVLEEAYIDGLLTSSSQFQEFVAAHWDRVYQAAFVFHLQPHNPAISSLALYVALRPDGKARKTEFEIIYELRIICKQQHITLRAFTVDGDTQYDSIHSEQDSANRCVRLGDDARDSKIPDNLRSLALFEAGAISSDKTSSNHHWPLGGLTGAQFERVERIA